MNTVRDTARAISSRAFAAALGIAVGALLTDQYGLATIAEYAMFSAVVAAAVEIWASSARRYEPHLCWTATAYRASLNDLDPIRRMHVDEMQGVDPDASWSEHGSDR